MAKVGVVTLGDASLTELWECLFSFKKKLQRTSLKLVKMVLPTVTPVKRSVTLRNASLTAAPVSAGANFHTIAPELVPFRVELHCTAQHSTVRIPIVMSSREKEKGGLT